MLLNNTMDYQHPEFFISHADRLSALLDVVVEEASAATDPQACIDYLELTDILVKLLDQSQLYSVLSLSDIQKREKEVSSFVDKVQTVQEAVGDWDTRTRSRADKVPRKRARSFDIDTETAEALKRPKYSEMEQDVVEDAAFNMQFGDIKPSIETLTTPWWTEPFYD